MFYGWGKRYALSPARRASGLLSLDAHWPSSCSHEGNQPAREIVTEDCRAKRWKGAVRSAADHPVTDDSSTSGCHFEVGFLLRLA